MAWWGGLGTKAMIGGGAAASILGRRAFTPVFVVGSAFSAAGWFGIFEITTGFLEFAMPVPKEPDEAAHWKGVATVPVSLSVASYAGWRTSPALAVVPDNVTDISGWIKYLSRLPVRHFATVGAASAVVSAVGCRVVQYRGGA